VLSFAGRLLFSAFCFLSAALAVLAAIPFTYVQVIQLRLLPGQGAFMDSHRYLYWIAAAAAVFSLRGDLRDPRLRRGVRVVIGILAAVGLLLAFYPVMLRLRADDSALIWVVLFLALPGLLVWMDVRAARVHLRWADVPDDDDGRLFGAAWWSALFVWGTYSVGFAVRFVIGLGGERVLPPDQMLMGALVSLSVHVVLFLGVYTVISVVRALASFAGTCARAEFWLFVAASVAPVSLVVKGLILGAVSYGGVRGALIAVAFAATGVAALAGVALRLPASARRSDAADAADAAGAAEPIPGGVELFLRPLALVRRPSRLARVLACLLLSVGGVVAVVLASRMDWNYLVQTLAVLPVWVIAFATLYVSSPRRPATASRGLYLLAALLSVLVYQGVERLRVALHPRLLVAGLDLGQVIDRYAGREISYRTLREALHAAPASQEDARFYSLLQKNSNLARQIQVTPADVDFAPGARPTTGFKPNVFIFVIDSLRRDYIGAYNPQVTFTPQIAAFARESIAFSNTFTAYGGTGLSEPSIWVGGRIPHKLYITPFHPMNALQKLLELEGYRAWISVDLILSQAITPWPELEELDRTTANKDYDLCRTLGEVQGRLDNRPRDRPLFVYSQPQNIHISNIAREGSKPIDGEAYPGFYAPYASRLRRIDRCFGAFIDELKRRDLYDSSVVVLTADHGDSLGEAGRWGHAYTIFPEILRVPFIVHVPRRLLEGRTVDPQRHAFQMEITATLYDLLGHPPTLPDDTFGRSVLPRAGAPAPAERPWNVVTSSYGPVWGVLGPRGRWLYIADAVNFRDYYFDLVKDPLGDHNLVDPAVRAENTPRIRQVMKAIHDRWKMPVFE
jgi:arylsulfatase A-like enzyme